MEDEPDRVESDYARVTRERAEEIARFRGLPLDAAWQELKAAFTDREHWRNRLPTIWEGPGRTALAPLPLDLLKAFIREHGDAAGATLLENSSDPDTAIAGYCIFGLSWMSDPRLPEAALKVKGRVERIFVYGGCMGAGAVLSAYARRLARSYRDEMRDTVRD